MPRYCSNVSVEGALLKRRSVRDYNVNLCPFKRFRSFFGQLRGSPIRRGFRTAPSAGAPYLLEVYVAIGNVENLSEGVYKYELLEHEVVKVLGGDKRM